MKFIVTKNEPSNTELASEDGAVWYTVDPPRDISKRTTVITKMQPERKVIAQVHWRNFSPMRLQFGQTLVDGSVFLQRKGVPNGQRYMVGADEQEYIWKGVNSSPELYSLATGNRIAYYKNRNIFSGRKGQFFVEPEAECIVDSIIIAFAIIEADTSRG